MSLSPQMTFAIDRVSCRVSENEACKMSVDNLAVVFGPTVVGYSSAEPTMNHIMVQTKMQQLVSGRIGFWVTRFAPAAISVA